MASLASAFSDCLVVISVGLPIVPMTRVRITGLGDRQAPRPESPVGIHGRKPLQRKGFLVKRARVMLFFSGYKSPGCRLHNRLRSIGDTDVSIQPSEPPKGLALRVPDSFGKLPSRLSAYQADQQLTI